MVKNFRNKNRFVPQPVDFNPKLADLNPSLDGLDDYDIGFDSGSDDDLDLSISSLFPSNEQSIPQPDSSRYYAKNNALTLQLAWNDPLYQCV